MLVKEQRLVRAGRKQPIAARAGSRASVRPRIGLIADGDARNPATMSGTPYFTGKALHEFCGDVKLLSCRYRWLDNALRVGNGAAERVTRRRYSRAHSLALARLRSKDFARQARQAGCDLVFSAKDCKGVAYFPRQCPVIYWSDATFRAILGYYPSFRSLYGFSRREGDLLERRALSRAEAVIMLSGWAAASAVTDYGVPARKVFTFPYGPKLPESEDSRHSARDKADFSEGVRLLWVGVRWERKGGATALRIAEELRARGIPTELTVIGVEPPVSSPALRVIRRLNKLVPEELEQLCDEYRRAHFFVLPTNQEAGGSVFAEATSFGLPSIACRTGGVCSLIRHNVNGFTMPVGTRIEVYADLIQEHCADPELYRSLVNRTRDYCRRVANWEVWGERVSDIINDLLDAADTPSLSPS